ncbi:MAG TPA: ASCH domain-containing protein [Chitinophagaceae bacterium]|nr:ASCH domain-containing protein [Chitinophagaceae bacterium]
MPAYSFKERFVPLIKSGEKKQTIRSKRKRSTRRGEVLYLYFGLRTKWCTKIGEAICTDVKHIIIQPTGVFIEDHLLEDIELEALAKADGFPDWEIMQRWWRQTHPLPFVGDIIYWNELKN